MLDLDLIDERILEDLRARGHSDDRIAKMDAHTAFDEFLKWNGIIGYAWLYDTVHELDEAEVSAQRKNLDLVSS